MTVLAQENPTKRALHVAIADRLIDRHAVTQVFRVQMDDRTIFLAAVEDERFEATLTGWQDPRTLAWYEQLEKTQAAGRPLRRVRTESIEDVGHRILGIIPDTLAESSITNWLTGIEGKIPGEDVGHHCNELDDAGTIAVIPVSRNHWLHSSHEARWEQLQNLQHLSRHTNGRDEFIFPLDFWYTVEMLAEAFVPERNDFQAI